MARQLQRLLLLLAAPLLCMSQSTMHAGLTCYCNSGPGDGCDHNNKCIAAKDGVCSVGLVGIKLVYRCVNTLSVFGRERCLNFQQGAICCNNFDLCNLNVTLPTTAADIYPTSTTRHSFASTAPSVRTAVTGQQVSAVTTAFLSVSAVCIVLISLAVALFWRHRQHRYKNSSGKTTASHGVAGDRAIERGAEGDSSGRGVLELEMRTVSREFESMSKISTGRFGDVFQASWRGRYVAIKMFKLKDEEAFKWEKGLYWMYGLHHNNLLEFIAADTRDCQLETQQWLVTAHHPRGTLRHFLRGVDSTFTFGLACQFARSVASGLTYLHSSIAGAARCAKSQNAAIMSDAMGMGNKPSIAHCALSSDIVLIKDDMTCCLSDLTMATQLGTDSRSIQHANAVLSKAGVYRYMAPELLSSTINPGLFESFRQLDMYAFALLQWEILWVCPMNGHQRTHRLPFDGIIPHDAGLADWTHYVSSLHIRPPLCEEWSTAKGFWQYTNLMKSCWNSHANGRRTSLSATKTLQACSEEFASSCVDEQLRRATVVSTPDCSAAVSVTVEESSMEQPAGSSSSGSGTDNSQTPPS